MKRTCVLLSKIFILIILFIILLVNGIVFLFNSDKFINFICQQISNRTHISVDIKNQNLKVFINQKPKLHIGSILISNKNNKIVQFNEIDATIGTKINIDKITGNADLLVDIIKQHNKNAKKNQTNIDIKKLSDITINKTLFYSNKYKLSLNIDNLSIKKNINDEQDLSFKINVASSKYKYQLNIGNNNCIKIRDNQVFANKLNISSGDINVTLTGFLYDFTNKASPNFIIKGDKIPIKDVIPLITYIQKLTDPTKKFTENFINYKGTLNINLKFNNKITGVCTLNNISANYTQFRMMPVYFKKADFIFANDQVNSVAKGRMGYEDVTHTLKITNLMSKERNAYGEVISTITPKQTNKYLPKEFSLKNNANFKITYNIRNRIIDVNYYLNLPKHTSIILNSFNVSLENQNRIIFAHTHKINNDLYLEKYYYAVDKNNSKQEILTGNGYFIRKNNKFYPQYVTCTTNGFAPTELIGSFNRYVSGGEFNGKLKYDFNKEVLTGKIEVRNTIFNHFRIKLAQVIANENNVNITANGKYKGQLFHCLLNAKNDFKDKIIVKNMDLFLDKFIIRTHKHQTKSLPDINSAEALKFKSQVRQINMDINKWNIKVNEIILNSIPIKDVKINGSLKNYLFKYEIPNLNIAKGNVSALGSYDFIKRYTVIDFISKDIDSNEFTTMFFNLPDQVAGIAALKIHSEYWENKNILNALCSFEIKEGRLPQLKNMEFNKNKKEKNKKVKISNYTNLDISSKDALKSNIKGNLLIKNSKFENIKITSQQKTVALLIKGNYELLTSNGELHIYGKFNQRAPKGIRIMKIPLNWIIKCLLIKKIPKANYSEQINEIPEITSTKGKLKYFKIDLSGNFKSDNIQHDFAELK